MQNTSEIGQVLHENGIIQPPFCANGSFNVRRTQLLANQYADDVARREVDADEAQRDRGPKNQQA